MIRKNTPVAFGLCFGISLISSALHAQVLYSDNFDSGAGDSGNWNVNLGAGNNAATFGFDYSTLGIPSAPHSTGGSTIGVKLEANYATGAAAATGVSISPTGQSFSGDYSLSFDFWSNYVGAPAGTGSGTTQLTGAGIGATGTTVQHASAATTSLWFGQTGDGGNSAAAKDYRIYSSVASASAGTGYAVGSSVYAAPNVGGNGADSANTYYAALGANSASASEVSTGVAGTTPAGAPGFKWHTGTIVKLGNTVTYTIDNTLIATVDASTVTLGGGNIELIQSDINAGASTDPLVRTYEFGLFDNIVVAVPEPTTIALATLGAVGLLALKRRKA